MLIPSNKQASTNTRYPRFFLSLLVHRIYLSSSPSSTHTSLPRPTPPMILAQFPVALPMSPSTSHRRHPSAPPAVVVQPTNVPGILSLAKPIRPSSRQQLSQSHPRQHRTPKPKLPASKTQPPSGSEATSKPPPPSKSPELPPTTTAVKKPATPAADKSARGRQSKAPKDKAATRYFPPTLFRPCHQPHIPVSLVLLMPMDDETTFANPLPHFLLPRR